MGAAFWLSLVFDWFFEPPVVVRVMGLLTAAAVLAGVVFFKLVRPLRVPLTDANMAMFLERRFPELDDTLLTAVSLGGVGGQDGSTSVLVPERAPSGPTSVVGLYGEMFGRTVREASGRIRGVRPGAVFNPVPLRRVGAAAVALMLSLAAFGLATPGSFGTWARRAILLSDELWPRRARLEVEGFEQGFRKVARGGDLEVSARAYLDMPLVPKTVEVRYRTESGTSGRATMNREGIAEPPRDSFQRYAYTFQGVLSSIDFELVGGDARVKGLRIEVVDTPKIDRISLICEYPAYMGRTTRTVPVIGPMRIPRGTRLRIEAETNKPLTRVRVDRAGDESFAEPILIEGDSLASDRLGFVHEAGVLQRDETLLFTLHDVDDIESSEPTRLALTALPDQPPEMSVSLHGIGTAITPQAQIPVGGTVRDDYGIAQIWFDFSVDESAPARKDIAAPGGNATELPVEGVLEVEPLRVSPGGKLQVAVQASDRCDLETQSRVGSSQRWLLEVVTPEQLRTRLQARELTLRHRFERIIQEVSETRDSLARIPFGGGDSSSDETGAAPVATEGGAADKEPGENAADWTGREPGETGRTAARTPDEDKQRELAVRSLRCERAIQNSRKNGVETQGTAEAFNDIRLQLINNAIDAEEWKARLKSGISDPLSEIAGTMFPELENRLLSLRESLADVQLGPERLDAAKRQVDAILVEMNRVLGRMMELEDFNQAIVLLEEIIKMQKKLEEQAQQRHRAALRDLLEE
ncbi:MAG TPA: hypothetical protein DD670_03155 [Planctomycetaceae bacterium]|nr:hypothetical protein [Planctomycetaceae bacterium]